ncbi:MAG: flagellar hook-basal body complex protein FliE [Hyphomicrobiaceae bacterium]
MDKVLSAVAPAAWATPAVDRADAGAMRASQVAPSAAGQAVDFSSVLAKAALSALDVLKAGEATAISGVQGKASVQQVAEQVMAAEQTLQTAIVVRDKVVAAYLELSRMQI